MTIASRRLKLRSMTCAALLIAGLTPLSTQAQDSKAETPVTTSVAPVSPVSPVAPVTPPVAPQPSVSTEPAIQPAASEPQPAEPATPPPAPPPAPQNESWLAWGGSLYVALENWSRIEAKTPSASDSKMGFGLGGDIGIGLNLDGMKALIGPRISLNRWSTTNERPNQTFYVEMADAGLFFRLDFGDVYIDMGTGNSTLSAGLQSGGSEIRESYSGLEISYTSVGLGVIFKPWFFGIGMTNYSEAVKKADRFEFKLGVGF